MWCRPGELVPRSERASTTDRPPHAVALIAGDVRGCRRRAHGVTCLALEVPCAPHARVEVCRSALHGAPVRVEANRNGARTPDYGGHHDVQVPRADPGSSRRAVADPVAG